MFFSLAIWAPLAWWIPAYIPIFITEVVADPVIQHPFTLSVCMLVLVCLLIPVVGIICDRLGKRLGEPLRAYRYALIVSASALLVLAYPCLIMMSNGNAASTVFACILLTIILAINGGAFLPFVVLYYIIRSHDLLKYLSCCPIRI